MNGVMRFKGVEGPPLACHVLVSKEVPHGFGLRAGGRNRRPAGKPA